MRVAWIEHEVERGPLIDSPHQGAIDGPPQPYPTPRPHGRGSHGALLPHRRRLPPPQPSWRSTLRIHKAPCGLRGHDPRTLPTAARRGERTLFLARCREVFLAPVPRSRGAAPFLVTSASEKAQALPGAPAPQRPLREDRKSTRLNSSHANI